MKFLSLKDKRQRQNIMMAWQEAFNRVASMRDDIIYANLKVDIVTSPHINTVYLGNVKVKNMKF